jgi:hypothetical protein
LIAESVKIKGVQRFIHGVGREERT